MQIERNMPESDQDVLRTEMVESPVAVVECFIELVEAGETGSAIRLLSRRIVERIGVQRLESIFSASSHEILSMGGIENMDVQTQAFSRDHAELLLTIWYGDHTVERESIELVREERVWKLSISEVDVHGEG